MTGHILFTGKYMKGFKKAWEELGYRFYEAPEELTKEPSEKNRKIIRNAMQSQNIDMIFSFDFMPGVSVACAELNICYISWIWDCPHNSLLHKSAREKTNRIFVFDYVQYQDLLARGFQNVYYLPLSPDCDGFLEVIEKDAGKSRERFGEEVVFLGNIYNDDKHGLYDKIQYLPPYVRGYLDSLMEAQKLLWGVDLIRGGISDAVWAEIKKYVNWDLGENYEEGIYEQIIGDMIGKKIAQLERIEMCSYLAEHFKFTLYSGSDTSFNKNIKNKGYAMYDTQMPLIFHYSKINIHITIRSITSGIPLRVMDVLACGGFLLTNYQPEIAEYFEDGKDLVIYQDLPDLYEKIAYYLEHDEEREEIAKSGQRKVRELFHYRNQIGKILEIIGE